MRWKNQELSKKDNSFSLLKPVCMHKRMSPHGDFDHMGETINLVNNFKVEKVIFNCVEYNDLEKELMKVLEYKEWRKFNKVIQKAIEACTES